MKQLLVVKPSSLGDIIHGLLVMETLRQRQPQLQIDWVVRDIFAPLVEACATVRRRYVFHRKGGLGAFGQLVTEIRETDYDAVVDMQGLARSGLLGLLSGVARAKRYGRSDARELSGLTYGHRARLPRQHEAGEDCPAHAVDILRQFLPLFGVAADVPLGTLRFASGELSPVVAEVLGSGRPLILLFPESRRPEKEWAGFPALTDLLLSAGEGVSAEGRTSAEGIDACGAAASVSSGASAAAVEGRGQPLVCWLGSSVVADGGRANAADFINLTGRTSLAELPALVGAASVVVANDSGPMHLAAAMGRNVVALFGPTDPRRYGPYPLDSPRHTVLRAASGRLADILPEAVAEAVWRLWAQA